LQRLEERLGETKTGNASKADVIHSVVNEINEREGERRGSVEWL
jgi:hypothetical protein